MPTKTPAKGKKAPAKDGGKKPQARAMKAAPKPAARDDDEADGEGGDEDDDDDDAPPAKTAAPAKKPAAKVKSGTDLPEAPPVVPARRLTPEAKAKVNEMVAKGMPLGDALKIAASWETFVAPVKEEPAKLVQGKSFEGGGGRPQVRRPHEKEDDAGPDSEDEEPVVEAEE